MLSRIIMELETFIQGHQKYQLTGYLALIWALVGLSETWDKIAWTVQHQPCGCGFNLEMMIIQLTDWFMRMEVDLIDGADMAG